MKTSSAKAKGRRLCQVLADALNSLFKEEFQPGDITVTPSGVNGPDLMLSPLARKHLPFEFECKNVEKIALWEAIAQAHSHVITNDRTPALVVSRNKMKEPWVCIPMSAFLKLLKTEKPNEPASQSP